MKKPLCRFGHVWTIGHVWETGNKIHTTWVCTRCGKSGKTTIKQAHKR